MKKIIAVGFALVMLSCTTQQTTPAAAPAAAPAVVANPEFKNLQVLPKDLTRDQLTTIMRSFSQALGVRCNECHVVTATEPRQQFDFASDAKPEKLAARVMIQTTMDLNNRWIPRVKAAAKVQEPAQAPGMDVSCWTCHRGKKQPENPAAPAPRAS
jgi:Photosynthetic reaction centre cytochrome C subunit